MLLIGIVIGHAVVVELGRYVRHMIREELNI